MEQELPAPPEPLPTHENVPAEPVKRRTSRPSAGQGLRLPPEPQTGSRGKRWLITAAVIIGGRVLVGVLGDQGDTSSAAAASACIDTAKFADEMSALDTWMGEVNRAAEAHDVQRFEGDLRTIGGILDSLALIAADDPVVAGRIREGAADARAAADAMAAGKLVAAQGYVFAVNADWKAVEQAVDASTLPAC
jgi:hypothetical protein